VPFNDNQQKRLQNIVVERNKRSKKLEETYNKRLDQLGNSRGNMRDSKVAMIAIWYEKEQDKIEYWYRTQCEFLNGLK
jgi:hypothetical protein